MTALGETHRPSTITRRIAAISVTHRRHGLETPTASPVVREVMKGIRRGLGMSQREATPVTIGEVRRMVAHLPNDLLGVRDKALLLIGFAGALRRSELVSLIIEDLQDKDQGTVITLRSSKTDQERKGRQVAIPRGRDAMTCPVSALHAWLDKAGIDTGPVFRAVDRHANVSDTALSDRAVALVIKRRVEQAGLDPTNYSGHSLG